MQGGVFRIFQEPPETLVVVVGFFLGGGGAAAPKPKIFLGTIWAKNMYYVCTVFPKTFCTQSRDSKHNYVTHW